MKTNIPGKQPYHQYEDNRRKYQPFNGNIKNTCHPENEKSGTKYRAGNEP